MFFQRRAIQIAAAACPNRWRPVVQRCGINSAAGWTRTRTNGGCQVAGRPGAALQSLSCALLPVPLVVWCDGATRSQSGKASEVDFENEESGGDGKQTPETIYGFTVKDTHGEDVSLEKYRGKVVLIVNIASKCGLTANHYKKLTQLKEKYGERGLVILNFPCNQFGSQMPVENGEPMVCHLRDSKADIGEVFEKIDVNGANAHPFYVYLKAKQPGMMGNAIKWNFSKFLVNREGVPVERYAPTTDPMDVAKDIEKLL